MLITNLCTDPNCTRSMGTVWNSKVTANTDGTFTYAIADGVSNGTVPLANQPVPLGYIVYVRYREPMASTPQLEYMTLVDSGTDWIATRCTKDGVKGTVNVRKPLTPVAMLIATQSDWQTLRSLGLTEFSGDTMPLA